MTAPAEDTTTSASLSEFATVDNMQVDNKADIDPATTTEWQMPAELAEPSWSFADLGPAPQVDAVPATDNASLHNDALDPDTMEGLVAATTEDPVPNIVDDFDGDQIIAQQLANDATADDSSDEDSGEDADAQDNQDASQDGQAAQAPNTDHFVWVDRGDAVDESSDCKLCMTTPGPEDDPLYVECGHVWCKSCLNQYFAQSFTDREQFPPRCCRPEGFNLEVIGMHLEDEVLIHVMDKWEEWTAADPTYCSNVQCNVFIPAYRVDGQWAVCLSCKVKTCVECKEGKARHSSPDQHPQPEKDEENAKLAETQGWKYCPNKKCNKIVEKIEGCDTITCICGQQFCYRCGNSLGGPYPCTCNGENAWVGQLQAWANGADGDNADAGGDDGAETDDDSESESDEEDDKEDSDDSDPDEEEDDEDDAEDDADGEDDQ